MSDAGVPARRQRADRAGLAQSQASRVSAPVVFVQRRRRLGDVPADQCAFVRISTNPKAVGGALTPAQAVAAIARMTTREQLVFWADDLPVASPHFPAATLQGHQQITDAYLLALCASRGGRLATFDTAIGAIAGDLKLVTNVQI